MIATTPILELRKISKYYGGTRALEDVSFRLGRRSIHAILGENGAGKSTLVKVLNGIVAPDSGEILLDGQTVRITNLPMARCLGIATAFQELSLVPDLSVAENLLIASPPRTGFGWVDSRREAALAREALAAVGLSDLDPSALSQGLSLPQKQLVEVAKALAGNPSILVLDEATSALSAEQVEVVFALLRRLRDAGSTILFISHRLHEIDAIADTCTVLRDGRHVETFAVGARSHEELCALLAGRELAQVFPPKLAPPVGEAPRMSVRGLSCNSRLRDVSLDLHPGEILGVGGLDGQGQKELMYALFGVIRPSSGSVEIDGRRIRLAGPAAAMGAARTIAFLPEERKIDGLLLAEPVSRNLVLSVLGRLARSGLRRLVAERRLTDEMTATLSIKAVEGANMPVGRLSGGNQQKVLLARLLALDPGILLLVDPTRGIDVGTKQEIYRIIRDLAASGAAVLYLATDYEELIGLCHRVVMFYGGTVHETLAGDDLTERRIIAAAMNLRGQQGVAA